MSISIETKCLHLEEKIENAEGECKSLQDGYYEIDFEDFESKVVQEEVKIFILCAKALILQDFSSQTYLL